MEIVAIVAGILTAASASRSNDTLSPTGDGEHILDEFASVFAATPYLFDEGSTCRRDADVVVREARSLDVGALKMLDATAKLPSGILSGNLNQYGDFDECVSASVGPINGKYCLATIDVTFQNGDTSVVDDLVHSHRPFRNKLRDAGHRIPKLETFNWGVCVPESCSGDAAQKALERRFAAAKSLKMDVVVDCVERGRSFSAANALAVAFFAFVGVVSLIATFVEVRGVDNALLRYARCFSLKTNISKLVKTDAVHDDIAVLHGCRFLNAVALLLSHKQMALMFNPFVNRTRMAETLSHTWSMLGRSAIMYTDTFILISGLLLSYSVVKELDQKGRINFRERLISRLFRFTPNLLALIVFCTFVLEHLGSGPQWGVVVTQYADLCRRHMWRNFLYIHNYFGFENMCLTHTHQLGIDMQLFLASPLLVYALWRNPRKGSALLILLAVCSTYLRYRVTRTEELSTLIYFGISVERLWKTANLSYILPTHRLTVYVAGLALGYFLRRRGRGLRLPRPCKWLGWTVAVLCALAAVFGPYHVSSRHYVYDAKDAALYNAFAPVLWVIFLSWGITACVNGWGGWFSDFLSWKYFAVFTRISYAVYLTQFPVFFYGVGIQRTAIAYGGPLSMIDVAEFGAIVALSVALTLAFDLPFQNIRKTYLESARKRPAKKEDAGVVPPRTKRLASHGD